MIFLQAFGCQTILGVVTRIIFLSAAPWFNDLYGYAPPSCNSAWQPRQPSANVMLQYTTSEAKERLTSKLSSAKVSLSQVDEFLREQIPTMEVNVARVYNLDVELRRAIRAAPSGKGGKVGQDY
ncbi:hypothetical protein HDV00_008249 [Rhizophlyctis rosea]|nr:hypothetical protein HDV00_008249 [Rhizophlyctis rosea]